MLTKDSFLLTHLFLCYQTLENMENYLYTRFSIETNGVRINIVELFHCLLSNQTVNALIEQVFK